MRARDLEPWGNVELVDRAGGGYVNEVWIGRLAGELCVLRSSSRSPEALSWEIELLEELQERNFGAPTIIPTRDGRRWSGNVVAFRWVEGSRPSSAADWRRVRDYLVRLHGEFSDVAQRPGFRAAVDLVSDLTGGLVELSAMPDEAAARCRRAWSQLEGLPHSVVHGDPAAENVFISDSSVILIDWDEARVDTPWFDLAALPDEVCPLSGDDLRIAREAASAWEAAVSWQSDNEYARWRLTELPP